MVDSLDFLCLLPEQGPCLRLYASVRGERLAQAPPVLGEVAESRTRMREQTGSYVGPEEV